MGEQQAKNCFPSSPPQQGCPIDYCYRFDPAVLLFSIHVLLSKLIKPTSDLLRLGRLSLQHKNHLPFQSLHHDGGTYLCQIQEKHPSYLSHCQRAKKRWWTVESLRPENVSGIPERSLSSEKPVNIQTSLLWFGQILRMCFA